MCHDSWAVVTPVKYEHDTQKVTSVLTIMKNMGKCLNGRYWLCTATPGDSCRKAKYESDLADMGWRLTWNEVILQMGHRAASSKLSVKQADQVSSARESLNKIQGWF